jgi:hypothetical protein
VGVPGACPAAPGEHRRKKDMGLKFDGHLVKNGNSTYILLPQWLVRQLAIDADTMSFVGDAAQWDSGVINLRISIVSDPPKTDDEK